METFWIIIGFLVLFYINIDRMTKWLVKSVLKHSTNKFNERLLNDPLIREVVPDEYLGETKIIVKEKWVKIKCREKFGRLIHMSKKQRNK
jgi:hypothetical protein